MALNSAMQSQRNLEPLSKAIMAPFKIFASPCSPASSAPTQFSKPSMLRITITSVSR